MLHPAETVHRKICVHLTYKQSTHYLGKCKTVILSLPMLPVSSLSTLNNSPHYTYLPGAIWRIKILYII